MFSAVASRLIWLIRMQDAHLEMEIAAFGAAAVLPQPSPSIATCGREAAWMTPLTAAADVDFAVVDRRQGQG